MARRDNVSQSARTERCLVARLRRGDARALDDLADRYLDSVYRFVLCRVEGDRADVEGIVQDTMVAAMRGIRGFRGSSGLYSWLCGIAKNKIADFFAQREARSRREIAIGSADDQLLRALEAMDSAPLPDHVVERDEMSWLVGAAMSSIRPLYAQVLKSRYLDGASVQDIAQQLDRSYKAAESLLRHARDAFRQAFTTIGHSYLETG